MIHKKILHKARRRDNDQWIVGFLYSYSYYGVIYWAIQDVEYAFKNGSQYGYDVYEDTIEPVIEFNNDSSFEALMNCPRENLVDSYRSIRDKELKQRGIIREQSKKIQSLQQLSKKLIKEIIAKAFNDGRKFEAKKSDDYDSLVTNQNQAINKLIR